MATTIEDLQAAIREIDRKLHKIETEISSRQADRRRLMEDRLLCQASINDALAKENDVLAEELAALKEQR